MPPSAAHVVATWTAFFQGSGLAGVQSRLEELPKLVSPDFNLVIIGEDSPLAVNVRGIAALQSCITDKLIPLFSTVVENPSLEFIRATGGGEDPWMGIELLSKGTSRAGK